MIRRRLRHALTAALPLLVFAATASAAGRAIDHLSVDYLYVDANEGGSSGGHVALRIGDEVFHFEHWRPGILVLRRAAFSDFRRHYTEIENRSIEVSRIPVSEDVFHRLRDRFRQRHFVQQQRLAALQTLREDRRILEQLLDGRIALEGAGFFDRAAAAEGPREKALVTLRERVVQAGGATLLADRAEMLRRRLAALDPTLDLSPSPNLSAETVAPPVYTFPQRYRDTLTAVVAVEILATAQPLVPQATITFTGDEFLLRDDEARALPRLSDALAASLVRLLDSRRPDWGFPLLLGMARLAALERTRESGRWVFLDTSAPNGAVAEPVETPSGPDVVAALLREARADLAEARRQLFSTRLDEGTFDERRFTELEDAANRVAEIVRVREAGRDLRVMHPRPLATRPEFRPVPTAPPAAKLAENLRTVVEHADASLRALKRLYGYNLVTRNCVSEMLREIDPGVFEFIPALSALTVQRRFGVSDVFQIPSRRRAALSRLYAEGDPVRVFLRESNTISSTLYRRNARDSIFLFFTDDVVATRPLFGAVNLSVGLASSAVGLATFPIDGGATFRRGVEGALFSLPELAFFNIRKGSFRP